MSNSGAAANLLKQGRYAAIVKAPFALDEVTLLSLRGTEALGELFDYEVELVSRARIRRFPQAIGQPMTVAIKLDDDRTRYFNGVICDFRFAGLKDSRRPIYTARLMPSLGYLAQHRNCRIFQEKTSIQIAREILGGWPNLAVKYSVSGPLPKREYCVQFNESDLDFIHRIFEQDGIYYFFDHKLDNNTLVIVNDASSHMPCVPAKIETKLNLKQNRTLNDVLWDWDETVSLSPGKIAMRDYNHQRVNVALSASRPVPTVKTGGVPTLDEDRAFDGMGGTSSDPAAATDSGPHATLREDFFYPGRFQTRDDGEFYARIRTESMAASTYRVRVSGSPRQLAIGQTFLAANPFEILDIDEAPKPTKSFLAVRIRFEISGDEDKSHGKDVYFYKAVIEAQMADTQFRLPLRTNIPVVGGPHTALVVGPKGSRVHADKIGRIKVQFFWDRFGKKNENSSCWIRVAQSWAGKGFGALITPRIGEEVVVHFVNGNPDWPLVTGAVYNSLNAVPENPEQHPYRSVIKTNSEVLKPNAFNALRFEDKAGSEEIYLKAEKDWHVLTGGSYRMGVGEEMVINLPPGVAAGPGLGSQIVATSGRIALTVLTPMGRQGIEIDETGITIIGASIRLISEAPIQSAPGIPIPMPPQEETELMTTFNAIPPAAGPPPYDAPLSPKI